MELQYDKKCISKYSHVSHFSLIQNNNNLLLVSHETHLWSLPGILTALCLSLPRLPPDFPLQASMDVRMCELLKFLLCKTAHRNLEDGKEQVRVERGQIKVEKITEQRKEERGEEERGKERRGGERREELPGGTLLPRTSFA